MKRARIIGVVGAAMGLFLPTLAAAQSSGNGNRYDLPRHYKADISAAKAHLVTQPGYHGADKKYWRYAVLIDVRTVEEFVAGHPSPSYNVPYPHIQSRPNKPDYIGQDPKAYFDYVRQLVPDPNTPVLTLCRTGYRSVLAANILSNPGAFIPGYENVQGYTDVYNIWEGFVGRYKVDTVGNELDLDNDGQLGDGDLDGWSKWAGLPWTTFFLPFDIYAPYKHLYPRRGKHDDDDGDDGDDDDD